MNQPDPERKAFQLCKNGAEHALKEARQIINFVEDLGGDMKYWKEVEKIIENELYREQLKYRNSPATSRIFG